MVETLESTHHTVNNSHLWFRSMWDCRRCLLSKIHIFVLLRFFFFFIDFWNQGVRVGVANLKGGFPHSIKNWVSLVLGLASCPPPPSKSRQTALPYEFPKSFSLFTWLSFLISGLLGPWIRTKPLWLQALDRLSADCQQGVNVLASGLNAQKETQPTLTLWRETMPALDSWSGQEKLAPCPHPWRETQRRNSWPGHQLLAALASEDWQHSVPAGQLPPYPLPGMPHLLLRAFQGT